MANFITVSENGQMEINWSALELSEEQVNVVAPAINGMIEIGHELTGIGMTHDKTSFDFYLKDERYSDVDGSLLYGAYVIVRYSTVRDKVEFDFFGRHELEKFGYFKGGDEV